MWATATAPWSCWGGWTAGGSPDGGYRGPFLDWTRKHRGIAFEVVQRSDGGRQGRWLPPGGTPPIGSPFRGARARVPGRGRPAPLGGRADLRVARPVPATQQGLRAPHHYLGGGHLPGHDPAPGAPPHPALSFSDTL